MSKAYARDLDLNLLRVFVVVAEERSVTRAASRLYLTQPAISAALKRLAAATGARLFVREGRGLALTARGERLLAVARPHLEALADAALAPAAFDPKTSERTLRLGLSDSSERWLLAPLLRRLSREAPRMRIVVLPVQFRTVEHAFASGAIDAAVTVADALPAAIRRKPLVSAGFTCLYDPRHARIGKTLDKRTYFAHRHVIVSYNGDLRGVVEDMLGLDRDVAVSIPTFHGIGDIVEGSALIATIPEIVAAEILAKHKHLRTIDKPFRFGGSTMDLLWPHAKGDDEALRFLRERIEEVATGRG